MTVGDTQVTAAPAPGEARCTGITFHTGWTSHRCCPSPNPALSGGRVPPTRALKMNEPRGTLSCGPGRCCNLSLPVSRWPGSPQLRRPLAAPRCSGGALRVPGDGRQNPGGCSLTAEERGSARAPWSSLRDSTGYGGDRGGLASAAGTSTVSGRVRLLLLLCVLDSFSSFESSCSGCCCVVVRMFYSHHSIFFF